MEMNILKEYFMRTLIGPWVKAGKECQYKITADNEHIYLFFQGSSQRLDWIRNFMFWPWPVKPYKKMISRWFAHYGFVKCWKEAQDKIVSDVLSHLRGRSLVIAGYSHGAAIALLAHEYFTYHGYDPIGYGFGCPRVLWMPGKVIKNRLKKFHVIRNRGDIVTHVPPVLMGFGHNQVKPIGKVNLRFIKSHYSSEYMDYL
jgi:hypothetical protein